MKITADTNFLVSATQWDNSVAYKILVKLIKLDAEIFTTKEILNEFSEVIQRDFEYNEEETNAIIGKVMDFVILVEPKERLDVLKEDSDDNKITKSITFPIIALVSSSLYSKSL